jgi:hypothetical protein
MRLQKKLHNNTLKVKKQCSHSLMSATHKVSDHHLHQTAVMSYHNSPLTNQVMKALVDKYITI